MSYDGGEYTSGEVTDSSSESSPETSAEATVGEVSAAFDEIDEKDADTVAQEAAEQEAGKAEMSGKADALEEAPEKTAEAVKTEVPPETPPETEETKSPETAASGVETAEKTDNPEVEHVTCRREDLAGQKHPETGVPYETTVVEVNGKQLEVTVPRFESKFDVTLEPEQQQLSRSKHNAICNEKLKDAVESDPGWAEKTFSAEQMEQIKAGKGAEGCTWHHDGGKVGRIQLVDEDIHDATRHTGGIAIWGYKSPYI